MNDQYDRVKAHNRVKEGRMERLLTVAEIADYLDVTEETVRRWLRSGRIEGTLLSRKAGYRIREGEVERLVREGFRVSVGKDLAAA
jgi:excisionase family DNA binding protein